MGREGAVGADHLREEPTGTLDSHLVLPYLP